MKSTSTAVVALAGTLVFLGACASVPARPATDARRVCVNTRQINSMHAMDDRHILVKASSRDYYLFTVDRGCSGLRHARGISIPMGRIQICEDGTSFISFDHPGVGDKRCRVLQIDSVEDDTEAKALIEARMARESPER